MELEDLKVAQLKLQRSGPRLFNSSSTEIRLETVPLRKGAAAQEVVTEVVVADTEIEKVLTVSKICAIVGSG